MNWEIQPSQVSGKPFMFVCNCIELQYAVGDYDTIAVLQSWGLLPSYTAMEQGAGVSISWSCPAVGPKAEITVLFETRERATVFVAGLRAMANGTDYVMSQRVKAWERKRQLETLSADVQAMALRVKGADVPGGFVETFAHLCRVISREIQELHWVTKDDNGTIRPNV